MTRQFLAAMVVAIGAMVGNADAGVAGGHFDGTVTRAMDGSTHTVASDFAPTGGAFFESFDGNGFPGTFTETNILFLSFWTATYTNDPDYAASGISLFSFVSLYNINEIAGSDDYSGIVFKTGPAQARTSGSGQSHAGN